MGIKNIFLGPFRFFISLTAGVIAFPLMILPSWYASWFFAYRLTMNYYEHPTATTSLWKKGLTAVTAFLAATVTFPFKLILIHLPLLFKFTITGVLHGFNVTWSSIKQAFMEPVHELVLNHTLNEIKTTKFKEIKSHEANLTLLLESKNVQYNRLRNLYDQIKPYKSLNHRYVCGQIELLQSYLWSLEPSPWSDLVRGRNLDSNIYTIFKGQTILQLEQYLAKLQEAITYNNNRIQELDIKLTEASLLQANILQWLSYQTARREHLQREQRIIRQGPAIEEQLIAEAIRRSEADIQRPRIDPEIKKQNSALLKDLPQGLDKSNIQPYLLDETELKLLEEKANTSPEAKKLLGQYNGYKCSFSQEICMNLEDPITITDEEGHFWTYEKSYLQHWIDDTETKKNKLATLPDTRVPLKDLLIYSGFSLDFFNELTELYTKIRNILKISESSSSSVSTATMFAARITEPTPSFVAGISPTQNKISLSCN